jgi:sugar lactone lactonase YvrE
VTPVGGRQGLIVGAVARIAGPFSLPLAAAAARTVPYCSPPPAAPRVLRSSLGVLESAIVDNRGRLFVTSQTWDGPTRGAVLRLDRPDAEPVAIAEGIASPGGLAFDDHGGLIVGYGNSLPGGLVGNVVGRAGLLRIHPDTTEREVYATGLSMANGVARAADGTIFASDDVGTHIDRVDPHGTVHRRWAKVPSANGLAIDPTGRYLYAAQTFVPAAIRRVDIANPAHVTTYAQPGPSGRAACLDGLAIDAAGRLYVAANGVGQIWRVDTDGTICAIARGLRFPSAVALGRGPDGFSDGNLYVVTFSGDIVAVAAAARAATETGAVDRIGSDTTDGGTRTAIAAPEPSTSEIRAWARANGIPISDRGRLKPEVRQAWRTAHAPGSPPR